MLIINGAHESSKNIVLIDGQNITEIKKYKQLNSTNNWNPCIPMPSTSLSMDITFLSTNDSIWRDWYPLDICDYQNNSVNYKNKYLFDGNRISLNNLRISNYMINNNRNYPIAKATRWLYLGNGSLINVSSVTQNALFYVGSCSFVHNYMSNITAEMILYYMTVKNNQSIYITLE